MLVGCEGVIMLRSTSSLWGYFCYKETWYWESNGKGEAQQDIGRVSAELLCLPSTASFCSGQKRAGRHKQELEQGTIKGTRTDEKLTLIADCMEPHALSGMVTYSSAP